MSIVVGGKFNRILNQITVLLVIFVNGKKLGFVYLYFI